MSRVSPEQNGIHGGDQVVRLCCPDGGEDLLDCLVTSEEPEGRLLAGSVCAGDARAEVSRPVGVCPGGRRRPADIKVRPVMLVTPYHHHKLYNSM